MIDWVVVKENMQRIILILLFVMVLWSPVYTLILLVVGFALKNSKALLKKYSIFLVALLVVCALATGLNGKIFIIPTTLKSYLFSLNPVRMMATIIMTLIAIFFEFGSADKWLVSQEKKRQEQVYAPKDKLEFSNCSHCFVAGTTGAGKTQLLLRFALDSIQRGEPLYIISGKGSNDKKPMLDDIAEMCKAYHRKLYVVSMNPKRKERVPYNPFKDYQIVEVADALVNSSHFSEEHYKYCLSTWVKAVCEVMKCAGIEFSLKSIVFFMKLKNFSALLQRLVKEKIITQKEAEEYAEYKDIAEVASGSRARFLNILLGEGKEVLGDQNAISADDVRRENAVLFIDLDSFSFTDFTSTIGAFAINDIRHLIGTETKHGYKRVIMDELSTYVTEQIMPLFSQSRSFGYQLIVATQSLADIEMVNEKLAVRILENCGQYGILQLNSAEDAEKISKVIGTMIAVETTRKSTGTHLHYSATGSKKIVNAFKVPPDTIKELQPLEVLFYEKKKPDKVKKIKLQYGWKNA